MDALSAWWVHTVTIQRKTGEGAFGDHYDEPATLRGFVDDRRRLVRDGDGNETVSESTVLLPIDTAHVPLGSQVTLPATFGSRTSTVLAISRHDGGGQPTPDHLELALA